MWWKIYLWVTAAAFFGINAYIASNNPKIGDLLVLILTTVSLIGLYAFVYKKTLLGKNFSGSF